jgi:hypothetical protein
MLSTLSSSLPLVLPRSKSLSSITFSVVLKYSTQDASQTCAPLRHRKEQLLQAYIFFEFKGLVHFTGEAINQEATSVVCPAVTRAAFGHGTGHGILEKGDGNVHWDDGAFLDTGLDERPILRAFAMLLSAEEVTGWEEGTG